ncbi:hypothetical protein GCM10009841_36010 [Microlunatus panaciterrae]|uniref:Uncharacterized protein n=1 Tax=Microlunatus panaciterrae TaxID=400768 RepID=A0ABS2RGY2_9ACTN|nr:hypothetical protein [Microlunatus panaciterrae]
MDVEWEQRDDGSLVARGEFASVEVRPVGESYVVASGGAMRGKTHGSLDAAKECAEEWLEVLEREFGPTA